jgi:hypothetical protein
MHLPGVPDAATQLHSFMGATPLRLVVYDLMMHRPAHSPHVPETKRYFFAFSLRNPPKGAEGYSAGYSGERRFRWSHQEGEEGDDYDERGRWKRMGKLRKQIGDRRTKRRQRRAARRERRRAARRERRRRRRGYLDEDMDLTQGVMMGVNGMGRTSTAGVIGEGGGSSLGSRSRARSDDDMNFDAHEHEQLEDSLNFEANEEDDGASDEDDDASDGSDDDDTSDEDEDDDDEDEDDDDDDMSIGSGSVVSAIDSVAGTVASVASSSYEELLGLTGAVGMSSMSSITGDQQPGSKKKARGKGSTSGGGRPVRMRAESSGVKRKPSVRTLRTAEAVELLQVEQRQHAAAAAAARGEAGTMSTQSYADSASYAERHLGLAREWSVVNCMLPPLPASWFRSLRWSVPCCVECVSWTTELAMNDRNRYSVVLL